MGLTIEQQRARIRLLRDPIKVKPIKRHKVRRVVKEKKPDIFNLSHINEIVDIAENRRLELINKATEEEKSFSAFLDNHNINYEFQYPVYFGGNLYILDFFFLHLKLNIEIDGFYHFTKEGKKKDKSRDNKLRIEGVSVIRISNSDLKKFEKIYYMLLKNKILQKINP